MVKQNDASIVLLFFFLLLIVYSTKTKFPIQNKGSVEFGNYEEDMFGCRVNGNQVACDPNLNQMDMEIYNNPTLTNGYYAKSYTDNTQTEYALNVAKTEDLQFQSPLQDAQSGETTFGHFAKELFLPKSQDNDISIERPEMDARDRTLDEWRNTSQNKNVMNDLREYEQEYSEKANENPFKNMSVEEYRVQNIAEWNKRVQKTLNPES